jgi:hypothetical protein
MKSVELLTLNNNYDKNSFDDGKNKNGWNIFVLFLFAI